LKISLSTGPAFLGSKSIDGVMVRFTIATKPDEVDITLYGIFYFAAAVYVSDVSVDDSFKQHLRIVRSGASSFVGSVQLGQVNRSITESTILTGCPCFIFSSQLGGIS
jgi:hypothetical protein